MTQSTDTAQRPALLKTLGVFDGFAILVGITIGAGIFSTPRGIAGLFESFTPILLLWIIAGVFIFIGGLIYAELGSRLPDTGGEYVYISRAFGPFAGFMFGWAQLFIIRTSPVAGLAIVTADYLGYFVELGPVAQTLTALAVIAVLGALNYIGVRPASLYQRLSTVVKVGGLLFLVALGLILSVGQESLLDTTAAPAADMGAIGSVVAALMLVVFSYVGFERVGYSAGEMKNPQRAIPLSMFFGIGAIMAVYILANMLYHQTLGMEGVRASAIVASDTATRLMGPLGAGFVTVIVMVSTTGSINGTMMTATRVYYAMARDGLFFRWLDYVHPDFHTPSRAILAHCVWGAVILLVRGTFEAIASGMVFAILIFFALTTLALFKFRREDTDGADAYRAPFYPWLPGFFLIGILILLVLRGIYEWRNSLIDLSFIATGLPFSLIWVKKTR